MILCFNVFLGFTFLNYCLHKFSNSKLRVVINFCAAIIVDIDEAEEQLPGVSGLKALFRTDKEFDLGVNFYLPSVGVCYFIYPLSFSVRNPVKDKMNYVIFQGAQDKYVTLEYTKLMLNFFPKDSFILHELNCGHFELLLPSTPESLFVVETIVSSINNK